jgi:hypothetical protein
MWSRLGEPTSMLIGYQVILPESLDDDILQYEDEDEYKEDFIKFY